MKIQNYLCDKLGFFIFFFTFLTSNIPYFLWTVYIKIIFGEVLVVDGVAKHFCYHKTYTSYKRFRLRTRWENVSLRLLVA